MTKKHFIALADVVRRLQPKDADVTVKGGISDSDLASHVGQTVQWRMTRDALADFCQAQNAQFNRERWLGYIDGTNGPNGGLRPTSQPGSKA